ncbi:MAG TPA: SIMPL domain-containing protein [Pirellulales bacterium]|nr:SIMPL domain-containing protein [Pirellulales bacterium]
MKWSLWTFAVLGIFLLFNSTHLAWAQEVNSPANSITVSGSGETMVKPNKLEIEIKTSVSAELTGDAVVKYRDALHRAKETVEKLKIENLRVVDQGVAVTSAGVGAGSTPTAVPVGAFIAQGGSGNNIKQEVGISKSWKLTVSGIDKLPEEEVIALVAKFLDVIKDAGLAAGSSNPTGETGPDGQPLASPLVTFVADDVTSAHRKAVEQAFQHAKEKAQQVAELTGGHLGAATTVDETTPLASNNNDESAALGMLSAIYSGGTVGGDDASLKSTMLSELPLRVSLRVRFALIPSNSQTNTTSISSGTTK